MLLCLENDLGFTDQKFWGKRCNSESGVVILFDNTCRGGKTPRAHWHTHALAHSEARSLSLLGSAAPKPRELPALPGTWGKGSARRGGGSGQGVEGDEERSVCRRIICPESQIFTA